MTPEEEKRIAQIAKKALITDVRLRFLGKGESIAAIAEALGYPVSAVENAIRFDWMNRSRKASALAMEAVDLLLKPMLPPATALPDDSAAPDWRDDATGRIQ